MKYLISMLFFSVLVGCGPFTPGSLAWFSAASLPERIAYFQGTCESYGFKPGTDAMASCVAQEIQQKEDENSASLDRIYSRMTTTTRCNTFGYSTTCNSY